MKIKYKFGEHFHEGTNKFYNHVIVENPYEFLDDIQDYNSVDDVEAIIDMVNEIIKMDTEDFGIKNGLSRVRIEFGANLSRIYGELGSDNKYNIVFKTKDFLKMCEDWRDFLIENGQ